MSKETLKWLNKNVLIGYAEKRGHAWHYRMSEQEGEEPNHYPGAIPAADVSRRLFDWEPMELPLYIEVPDQVTVHGKKAIVPSDELTHVFGIFSEGYQFHGYEEWLVGNVSNIIGDTLNISSAGLLKGRAVAWVEVSMAENVTTPEGVIFRPNMLATTSLDGTVATTVKRTVGLTVCDNTWAIAMKEKGQTYKRKHTRYSNGVLEMDRARQALEIIHQTADEVSKDIERLCQIAVTEREFHAIVASVTAPPTTHSESKTGQTLRKKKVDQVTHLYCNDERVSPWQGTAFGVLQCLNTWEQHIKPVRGDTERAERNMLATINGGKEDDRIWGIVKKELCLTS